FITSASRLLHICFAFASHLLSDLLSPTQTPDFNDIGLILAQLQMFHWKRKFYCSTVINVLAQALYSLFSAADGRKLILYKNVCIMTA
ncbi:6218_t:CDS:1, partial [Cetraspora pellucida]